MPKTKKLPDREDDGSRRDAVLRAAGQVFLERGYESATTLEIARRARVSKRTLYELFGSKQDILTALIRSSSARMNAPLDLPLPQTRDGFFRTLRSFGSGFLTKLVDPSRIAMYRLAIAEVQRSGRVAEELDRSGRGAVVEAATRLFRHGAERGFFPPEAIEPMVAAFFNVLIGPLQIGLLLGVESTPTESTVRYRVGLAISILERIVRSYESGGGSRRLRS